MPFLAFGLLILSAAAAILIAAISWGSGTGCGDECKGAVVYLLPFGLLLVFGVALTAAGVVALTRERQLRKLERRDRELHALRRRNLLSD